MLSEGVAAFDLTICHLDGGFPVTHDKRGDRYGMAFSDLERARVTKRMTEFCQGRAPAATRDRVRVDFRTGGSDVVLFEERPSFHDPHEWLELVVAKFKFVRTAREWRLYCQHRDRRWHEYEALPRSRSLDRLLQEVDADPTGIFWG